jgi:hypothetical protein
MTTIDRLETITQQLLAELECSEYGPAAINSGECATWADRAADEIGGTVRWIDRRGMLLDGSCGDHAVLELDGQYYDAETMDGTDDLSSLEWVERGGCGIEYTDDDGTMWAPWDKGYNRSSK